MSLQKDFSESYKQYCVYITLRCRYTQQPELSGLTMWFFFVSSIKFWSNSLQNKFWLFDQNLIVQTKFPRFFPFLQPWVLYSTFQRTIKFCKRSWKTLDLSIALLHITQRPADSRSAGFTCSYLCLPLSLIGLVNAYLRKPPALSADGSLGNVLLTLCFI